MKKLKECPFGERLRKAYGGADNSKIARQLKRSDAALTNYMKGRVPPAELLVEISAQTGFSIHWLLTGNGPEKLDEEARSMVAESRAPYGEIDLHELRRKAVEQYLYDQLKAVMNGGEGSKTEKKRSG